MKTIKIKCRVRRLSKIFRKPHGTEKTSGWGEGVAIISANEIYDIQSDHISTWRNVTVDVFKSIIFIILQFLGTLHITSF